MNNETIEIKKKNVLAAYETARKAGADSTMKVLEVLFGEKIFQTQNVTERIKTFDDAIQELGEEHPYVEAYREVEGVFTNQKDIDAYLKLRIICAALNEDWKPNFISKKEYRWAPCFLLYTKEEYDALDTGAKPVNVFWSYLNNVFVGLTYVSAKYDSYAEIVINSRLAFKSEELAKYAGKQFLDIYADFLLSNTNK